MAFPSLSLPGIPRTGRIMVAVGVVVTDILNPAERSYRMSLIRCRDTKPELFIRRLIYSLGYRYRLYATDLPGRPDVVFRSRRKVIFVHGCFWHRHPRCPLARLPKSNLDFWVPKLAQNRQRDFRNIRKLRRAGWKVAIIWECEVRDTERLRKKIRKFLDEGKVNE